MNVTEAAVAEDTDDVAFLRFTHHVFHDRFHRGQIGGWFAGELQVLQELLGIQPLVRRELFETRHLRHDDQIRTFEGIDQFGLEDVAPGGVGTRLEDGPEPPAREPHPQRPQRFPNRRGMMAKIIDHTDPPAFPAKGHPPFHPLEAGKGRLNLGVGQAAMSGTGRHGQSVADVEFTDQGNLESGASDLEFTGLGPQMDPRGPNVIRFAEPESLHRTVPDVQERRHAGIVAIGQQQAVPRDEVEEAPESELDIRERTEDVGMVHLQVVQQGDFGEVVDELAAFVEERGVILVAFQDEPRRVGEPRALTQVGRDTADEERGIQSGALEHPGEQRRGGGLAVGAGDDQRAFPAQKAFLEQLRQGAITQLVLQHEFCLRIPARNRVADHHQIRAMGEVGFRITRARNDPAGRQEGGHGRINDVLVGTGHGIAAFAQGDGNAGHGRAADANEMDALKIGKHGRGFRGREETSNDKMPGEADRAHRELILTGTGGRRLQTPKKS